MEQIPAIRLNDQTKLCAVQLKHAEELFTVISRNIERLGRWLPWATPSYSLDDARQFLDVHSKENADRSSLVMLILHQGALCGAIGLHRVDRANRNTSVGYWLDEAHEGKGIITSACRAIVTEGFNTFGLHRIEIRCATWNHRSSAVPRRLGFVEEGILRDAEWLHDKWVDLRVFSMLARDWKG